MLKVPETTSTDANGPGYAMSKTVIITSPRYFKAAELPAYAQRCPALLDSTPVEGRWALVPFQNYQA